MPTGSSAPRRGISTSASAPSRSDSPTARCSASARSTMRSTSSASDPVRKLDPPVRAALRLGAYQLGYTDTAPHAAANESVELVRRARLERAVPFTERRHAPTHGGHRATARGAARRRAQGVVSRRIAETFEARPRPRRRARAHELDERAPRDRRAPARRRPARRADRTFPARIASRASTISRLPAGGSGRRAAARSFVGLVVGSQEGERTLDLCSAPGGKTSQLRGDVTAVENRPEPRKRAARESRRACPRDGRLTAASRSSA